MVFPWIPFLKERAGGKLSDIEFLAVKDFDGKLVKNEGVKSATGDLATLTASSGKDMYVARAKVSFTPSSIGTGSGEGNAIVKLKINGTVVETARYSWSARSTSTSNFGAANFAEDYEFKNIGHKVAATQIIKLEVVTLTGNTNAEGFVECFEETTGETPQVASI